jgi:hypothetical protein
MNVSAKVAAIVTFTLCGGADAVTASATMPLALGLQT